MTAHSSEPLDLSGLTETATIQPDDLVLALWVLSVSPPPPKIVLPRSLLVRRRLGRAGLVFAADRRNVTIEIDQERVSIAEALGVSLVDQLLPLEYFDLETSDRMRVVSKLEERRPVAPDNRGRRYYWIDGLGVAAGHPDREFFDRHAEQCFFESVDNVYRWSSAHRAVAIVSATAGGGGDSYNRLQIVVLDNGIGILSSAKQKALALPASGELVQCISLETKPPPQIAINVIADLLENSYKNRRVIGARTGHGLNTATIRASRWNGTVNVVSSFSPGGVVHRGRRGHGGAWTSSQLSIEGTQGTAVHFTLDAVKPQQVQTPSTPCDGGSPAPDTIGDS